MILKEISASFGATWQMEAYNPVKFFSSVKIELEEGDDPSIVYSEAYRIARESVREQMIEVKQNKKESTQRDNQSSLLDKIKTSKPITK